jgi:hypothetical protein
VTVYDNREIRFLSDVYSNFYPCTGEYGSLTIYQDVKKTARRENVLSNIVCRSKLACVRFLMATHMLTASQINVLIGACVAYENGSLDWVRKQIAVPISLKNGESISDARVIDLYGGCSEAELEFRFNVEWDTVTEEPIVLKHLIGAEWNENEQLLQEGASITVVRGEGNLWEYARKYKSTVQLIQTYNELEDDVVLSDTMLLIPRQRK